jgi:hypothetical protein
MSVQCLGLLVLWLASGCRGVATEPVTAPDWVNSGGQTPRYADARFVTGFARASREEGLDVVKARAAADLAAQLEVRIEHELRDVSEERDGVYAYQIAAITRATVGLSVGGLRYESFSNEQEHFALAWLEREAAARQRRAALGRTLVEVEACLASGARHESEGRGLEAASVYDGCRLPVAVGLEHTSLLGVLTDATPEDRRAHSALVSASRELDTRSAKILARPVANLAEAADALALQLLRQAPERAAQLRVEAFQYGTAEVSSAFGRQAARELEGAVARRAAPGEPSSKSLVARGVYLEEGASIRLHVIVKEVVTSRLVASAATHLPAAAVPAMLPLKPVNFEAAVAAQRVLGGGDASAGLRLEMWTTDGRRGLVYGEGESYELFLRANRPAWVRLVYVLQGGEQVPLEEGFRIGADQVGEVVRYPRRFEVIAPFGVEHFHATAFSDRPPPLRTRKVRLEGEIYEVVDGGLAAIERARAERRTHKSEAAEAFIAVTTTPLGSWP